MRAHGHHHGHGAHRHHGLDDRPLAVATAINLALSVLQIVAGLIAGSLALVADAVHNLSDALSLVIALAARRIARWPAHGGMTFGYRRAEIIAALINLTTLVAIGFYLVWEAVVRLLLPEPVRGDIVLWVASFAFLIDLGTVLLTARLARESVNVRAAFLHNLADMLGSVAVILAGGAILLYGWQLVDPAVTLLIAGYMLWHGFREMGPVVRILMGATPVEIDVAELEETLCSLPGVRGVHHLHVWALDERELSLEAHIVVPEVGAEEMERIKHRVKRELAERFGIHHTTLEMEFEGELSLCPEYRLIEPH